MSGYGETDLEELVAIVRRSAKAEVMPRFRSLQHGDTLEKTSDHDLVTVADTAMEAALTAGIEKAFPGVTVVGEEGVFADPSLQDRIGTDADTIILDPIDGTWNFAHGLPLFGVIAAVTENGRTVAGIIYDPVGDDHVCAIRGQGAWQVAADGSKRRLRVAEPVPAERMSFLGSTALFPKELRGPLADIFHGFARTHALRCSAHEYRLLSQGSVHASINAMLKPWDHAAGQLIHTEAGGFNALVDGTPYSPVLSEGRLLLAPDEGTWNELAARFAPVLIG